MMKIEVDIENRCIITTKRGEHITHKFRDGYERVTEGAVQAGDLLFAIHMLTSESKWETAHDPHDKDHIVGYVGDLIASYHCVLRKATPEEGWLF